MFFVMLFTVEITRTALQAIRSRLQDNPDEVSESTQITRTSNMTCESTPATRIQKKKNNYD
jgi:hypothetical protein